uniref:anthocyanidin 3-O-glucosyltransferase n=1 Tax=Salix viminalis TaxID=40686 RepID=A0A6N2L8W1_SALVM
MSDLCEKQIEELSWGLKNSNYYFLWVIKESGQVNLPKTFLEDLGEKGCVVGWSPQVRILSNEAVGCFLTHCGWNSTIEALSLGMPMVAMPQWTDQPPNAKLVEDVWKVGIRVKVDEKGIVPRDEIQCCIKEVMEGGTIEAVSEGGSSDKNIDELHTQLGSVEVVAIDFHIYEAAKISVDDYLKQFQATVTRKLTELVAELNTSSGFPISCLAYDSLMPWVLEIARHLGLIGASFFTQSCAVDTVYYHIHEGQLKIPPEKLPLTFSSQPVLEITDLPSFVQGLESKPEYSSILNMVVGQFSTFMEADWIFVNTFKAMEEEESWKGHVLLVPYPGQGHINPMMQFSRRLISKGVKATLVTSIFIAKAMKLGSSIGPVHLDVISDGFDEQGFPKGGSSELYLENLEAAGSKTLAELIVKYRSTPYPIDCVIYEPFLHWALDVAKDSGVMGAAFFTQPCVVDYIYYNIQHGLLSLPITSAPVSIPGLPLLESRDMPSFIGVPGSYPAYFKMLLDQFSNTDRVDYILINTFYKLEAEAVDTISKIYPTLTIGPTVPSIYLDLRIKDDDYYNLDLFTLQASISTNWISNKPPSMSDLCEKQIEELSWGLKNSNYYFLWESGQVNLPKTFLEDLGEKGCVVGWSPQVRILSNEAVGCFLTHCGWNSTIEALSLGMPMVAMPQWTDQPPNAKLVEDVWKVGIRVKVDEKGIVPRDEIECCIKEVMEGEKGIEMKKNAKKWRELAIEAVSEGGSSDKNIDELVSKILESKN